MQRSILARLGEGRGEIPLLQPTGCCFSGDVPEEAPSGIPEEPSTPAGPGRSRWRWIAIAVLAAVLVAWMARGHWMHAQFRWQVFAASFARLDWRWIGVSVVLILATYYTRVLRWAVILKPVRPEAGLGNIFKATLIGFTALALLGRPGELVRPYLIAMKERVPFTSQVAAWFLERIYDLLAVILLFGFSLSQIHSSRARLGPSFQWILETGGYLVTALGLLCVAILIAMGRYGETVRRRLVDSLGFLPGRHHARMNRAVTAFVEGTGALKSQGYVLQLSLYTAFEWGIIVLGYVCIFQAYGSAAALAVQDILIFIGFTAFGGVVQIPGVGGGFQVVSIVVLTQFYGFPLEVAASVALVVWAISFLAVVPIGLLLAFHEGLNWRKFRDLERAARAGATGGSDQ